MFQVLEAYRNLHRARRIVFSGDILALEAAKLKIRQEFKNRLQLTDEVEIRGLVQMANETADFMRKGVIQGQADNTNTYKLNITKETHLHKNVPLKDPNQVDLNDYKVPKRKRRNRISREKAKE